jgi:hypothetical protein
MPKQGIVLGLTLSIVMEEKLMGANNLERMSLAATLRADRFQRSEG